MAPRQGTEYGKATLTKDAMISVAPTERPDVAATVRAASMDQHRNAESRPFIVALMSGKLSLTDYTRYLAQFAWIYEALETPRVDDPPLFDPRLARMASIENDLTALLVANWRTAHPALPSTQRYVDRLNELDDLPRRVAHHYTRYLGDLSGGQAISALVARHYGATPEQLSFFRFDEIENLVHYKRDYREAMNAIGFSAAEEAVLVAEVKNAFALNSDLFDELEV